MLISALPTTSPLLGELTVILSAAAVSPNVMVTMAVLDTLPALSSMVAASSAGPSTNPLVSPGTHSMVVSVAVSVKVQSTTSSSPLMVIARLS